MGDGSLFLGIDFGTSKCVMSWYNPEAGKAEIVLNGNRDEETPSIVYLGARKEDLLIGQDAVNRLENEGDHSGHYFVSVKRDLRLYWDETLEDGTTYTPEAIVKELFSRLKSDAERFQFRGQPVSRVVITYPAPFDSQQQRRIYEAAQAAGFTSVELLSEPEASVRAYCNTVANPGQCFLVYDFGAGTVNVAVIRRTPDGSFRPVGQPGGLSDCGGDDLDRVLYEYCEEIAQQNLRRSISLTSEVDLAFLRECRKRKENYSLSSQASTMFSWQLFAPGGGRIVPFGHLVEWAVFKERIRPYIAKTVKLTQDILAQTRQRGYSVDTFLVIGGSSRLPLVKSLLAASGVSPTPWNGDFAVALGAAYYGFSVWGAPQIQANSKPIIPKTSVLNPLPARPGLPPSPVPNPFASWADSPQFPDGTDAPWPIATPPGARSTPDQIPFPTSVLQVSEVTDPADRQIFAPGDRENRTPPTSSSVWGFILSLLFVLLFGALAIAQYVQGKDVLVVLYPWGTSTYSLHWPVTAVLGIVSLLLLSRLRWALFLTVVLFLLCLGMTLLILLGVMSLKIPFVPGIGQNIAWWIPGLLIVLLFILMRTKLNKSFKK